jgi:hypothetical protein
MLENEAFFFDSPLKFPITKRTAFFLEKLHSKDFLYSYNMAGLPLSLL